MMTQEDWIRAAEAHRRAADTFLRIFEPEAALIEMGRAVDAEAEAAKLAAPDSST